jgi:hypothetical protein
MTAGAVVVPVIRENSPDSRGPACGAGPQARERDVDALQRGRRAGAAEGGLGADPG